MDGNNRLLMLWFFFATIVSISCENNSKYISNLKNTDLKLSESVGQYVFLPYVDEDFNEYKLFNLDEKDSLILEINADSTFTFNRFYYNVGENANRDPNLNVIRNYQKKVTMKPNQPSKDLIEIPFPSDAANHLQGFITSKKDTAFYYRLSMKGFENYEYMLIFKKLRR